MSRTHHVGRLLAGVATLALAGAASAGDVVGTVADATGARPLRGAQVTVVEHNPPRRADDGGRDRFTGV
ncbi:hypothetical protein, partial [Sphingomonas sp.]|uniref:hypothetical protein n=1 Tax=Sphingomonas sp. TaxID=28214 RepID=UPI003B3B711F